jgi:hypothetical protein
LDDLPLAAPGLLERSAGLFTSLTCRRDPGDAPGRTILLAGDEDSLDFTGAAFADCRVVLPIVFLATVGWPALVDDGRLATGRRAVLTGVLLALGAGELKLGTRALA